MSGFFKKIRIEYLLSVIYFLFLLPLYVKPYEVPDYFFYHDLGNTGYVAKDGFSTLFLYFTQFCLSHGTTVQTAMLVLMTAAMFLFLRPHRRIEDKILKIAYIVFVFSLGSFWYFYGKIFYEFPFIAFVFAIMFNVFLRNPRHNILLFLLAGFCFSFKPHVIFPLTGAFFAFIIFDSRFRKYILNFKNIFISVSCFVLGYLAGNYGYFIDYQKMFSGIGYDAAGSIKEHLLHSPIAYIPWDHVTNYSVNLAVCNVITLTFILLLLPLYFVRKTNKYSVLTLNVFLAFVYLYFINHYSFGYTWHAFPISLYLIIILFFLLKDNQNEFGIYKKVAVLVFCAFQLFNNFVLYVPRQIKNFINTDIAYKNYEKQKDEIAEAILSNINPDKDLVFIFGNFLRWDLKTGNTVLMTSNLYDKISPNTVYEQKESFCGAYYGKHDANVNIYIKFKNHFEYDYKLYYDNLRLPGDRLIYNKNNITVYLQRTRENAKG